MNTDVMFSSKTDEWETPQDLFDKLNEEFHFTLDPCATHENHKCDKYYTKEDDGLSKDWTGETVFCNPPYGKAIGKWVEKCYKENLKGVAVVMLIPARTDTSWFHKYIYNNPNVEIRFLKGRLKFVNRLLPSWNENGEYKLSPAPFPSMIVIFRRREVTPIKHLKPGTVFNAGPVAVRVLEHFPDGKTLVITDKCIADRPFTCQPFKPNLPEDWRENNWRTSTLRADLNRDFLNSFDEAGGPILSENIIPAEWDLTDSAGNNDYGSVTDKIGLLTEAMFRKYSEQGLLDLDDWWWLITPTAGYSYYARYVNTNGTLHNSYAYNGYRGVRPALFVESEIEVELEDKVDLSPNA